MEYWGCCLNLIRNSVISLKPGEFGRITLAYVCVCVCTHKYMCMLTYFYTYVLRACSLLVWSWIWVEWGFPGGASGKEPACQCGRYLRHRFDPWVRKITWRRAWQPAQVFLPGESHGQRSLAGYDSLGCKESDMIEVTQQCICI